jgi:hypothetical protein
MNLTQEYMTQKTIVNKNALEDLCGNYNCLKLEYIKCLVDAGAKVGGNELIILCRNRLVNYEMVEYLISESENKEEYINKIRYGVMSALSELLYNYPLIDYEERLKIVKYMVDHGANINQGIYRSCLVNIYINNGYTLDQKIELVKYLKKYINDIDREIEYIQEYYVELDENSNKVAQEMINELERIESTTKSAAKKIL